MQELIQFILAVIYWSFLISDYYYNLKHTLYTIYSERKCSFLWRSVFTHLQGVNPVCLVDFIFFIVWKQPIEILRSNLPGRNFGSKDYEKCCSKKKTWLCAGSIVASFWYLTSTSDGWNWWSCSKWACAGWRLNEKIFYINHALSEWILFDLLSSTKLNLEPRHGGTLNLGFSTSLGEIYLC